MDKFCISRCRSVSAAPPLPAHEQNCTYPSPQHPYSHPYKNLNRKLISACEELYVHQAETGISIEFMSWSTISYLFQASLEQSIFYLLFNIFLPFTCRTLALSFIGRLPHALSWNSCQQPLILPADVCKQLDTEADPAEKLLLFNGQLIWSLA